MFYHDHYYIFPQLYINLPFIFIFSHYLPSFPTLSLFISIILFLNFFVTHTSLLFAPFFLPSHPSFIFFLSSLFSSFSPFLLSYFSCIPLFSCLLCLSSPLSFFFLLYSFIVLAVCYSMFITCDCHHNYYIWQKFFLRSSVA